MVCYYIVQLFVLVFTKNKILLYNAYYIICVCRSNLSTKNSTTEQPFCLYGTERNGQTMQEQFIAEQNNSSLNKMIKNDSALNKRARSPGQLGG